MIEVLSLMVIGINLATIFQSSEMDRELFHKDHFYNGPDMGAGRLSFNPKVMISRHQSSESEPIKNSQKLNQKLKISKKHFKNQLKLKESRSSSACGRLPGQKKKGSDFEDWWHEIIP